MSKPTEPSAGCVRAADYIFHRVKLSPTDKREVIQIIHRETQRDWKSNPAVRELVEAAEAQLHSVTHDGILSCTGILARAAAFDRLQAALEPFKEEQSSETK